jgi:hypothetical protein
VLGTREFQKQRDFYPVFCVEQNHAVRYRDRLPVFVNLGITT